MIYLLQILLHTTLLLGVWYISPSLIQILHMLFMLLVSLLLLILLFTRQLFFVFCDIFGIQFFRAFFHPRLPWSCVHTLMLIMVVIPQIASLLPGTVSFQVIRLFLNHPPKKNIVPWHLLLKRLFGYVGYLLICEFLFLILLLCIVTTRVLFKLLTTWFFMNELGTMRSIVILLVIISSMAPLQCLLFVLPCRLQISLPRCISSLIFVFSQLSNSRCLQLPHREMLNNIFVVLFIKGRIVLSV